MSAQESLLSESHLPGSGQQRAWWSTNSGCHGPCGVVVGERLQSCDSGRVAEEWPRGEEGQGYAGRSPVPEDAVFPCFMFCPKTSLRFSKAAVESSVVSLLQAQR